jgi:hypothetical protein
VLSSWVGFGVSVRSQLVMRPPALTRLSVETGRPGNILDLLRTGTLPLHWVLASPRPSALISATPSRAKVSTVQLVPLGGHRPDPVSPMYLGSGYSDSAVSLRSPKNHPAKSRFIYKARDSSRALIFFVESLDAAKSLRLNRFRGAVRKSNGVMGGRTLVAAE